MRSLLRVLVQPEQRGPVHSLMKRARVTAVLLGWAASGAAGAAQAPADGASPTERATVYVQSGVTTLELPNGVWIHFRPMKTGPGGKVLVSAFVPGVELHEDKTTRGRIVLAVESLRPSKGAAELRATTRPEGLMIAGQVETADLTVGLRQLGQTLAAPEFDERAFVAARERAVEFYDLWSKTADVVAATAAVKLLAPPDDVRMHRPTLEQLKSAEFAGSADALRSSIMTGAIDVSIVGPFEMGHAVKEARAVFGELAVRRRDRLLSLRDGARPDLPAEQLDSTTRGTRPTLTIAAPAPSISDLDEARVALVAVKVVERAVAEGLRAHGYRVNSATGAVLSGRVHPRLGSSICTFVLGGGGPPLAEAAAVARAAVERRIIEGPTAAEVREAAASLVEPLRANTELPEYWSSSLCLAWFLDVPIDELNTAPATVKVVTANQVGAHLRRWYAAGGEGAPGLRAGLTTLTIVPEDEAGRP